MLAKYRLQTEARDMMYGLVQIRRHSAEEVQGHHLELVKVGDWVGLPRAEPPPPVIQHLPLQPF